MLKTNIDSIRELLEKNGEMPVSKIATDIKADEDSVLNSAKLMESQGIVQIEYKFMKPYISLKKTGEAKSTEDKKEGAEKLDSTGIIDDSLDLEKKDEIKQKEYAKLSEDELGQDKPPETTLEKEEDKKKEEEKPKPELVVIEKPLQEPEPDEEQPIELEQPQPEQEQLPPDEVPKVQEYDFQSSSAFDSSGEYGLDELDVKMPAPLPENLDLSDVEELDKMIEQAHKLIDSGQTEGINEFYRRIYDSFSENETMTMNERDMFYDRIMSLFEKIRMIYA